MLPAKPEFNEYDLAYALPGGLASLASSGTWKYARHLKLIEDKLVEIHNKPLRLLISVPPQHGKSELCSGAFPAWYLGHYPTGNVMLLTYQETYSQEWGKKARRIYSELGPAVFGHGLAKDSQRVDSWETDQGGKMHSIGIGGAITGKSASGLLIVDDYVKGREEAMNPRLLEAKWDAFWSDIYSRLNHRKSSVVIIGTRWSEDDIIGRFERQMKQGGEYAEQFDVVRLPALAEEDDPLGRAPGEALVDDVNWPNYRSEEDWKKIRHNTPSHWWDSLYQQRPAPREGVMVNLGWFRYYDELPSNPDRIVISWDTAQKETELADFTVGGVFLEKEGNYYLAHIVRDRMSHPRLLKIFEEMQKEWRPHINLVEEKGSGISLIQHARECRINVEPMVPTQSKAIRMDAETPTIQAGRVLLPNPEKINAPWLNDFKEEVRLFPRGSNDDQADMLSQFLCWARNRTLLSEFDVW